MENESQYKNITDSLEMPVLVAKKIAGGDYEIIYSNLACEKIFDGIKSEKKLSLIKAGSVDWLGLVKRTEAQEKIPSEELIFETEKTSYDIKIKFTQNGMLTICLNDIGAKTFFNEQLRSALYMDKLTSLPNRLNFNKEFTNLSNECEKNGSRFALILFDLDNLNFINNARGHIEGDNTLVKSARIFRSFMKNQIQAFRFGDDEFAILANNLSNADSAITIADAVEESFIGAEIGISGGIAVFPDDSSSSDDLLNFADLALRNAKSQGKRRALRFTAEMQKAVLRKINYSSKMPVAFERMEFQLFFQPQFDIATNKLRGFEALLRWNESTLGRISPEDFIPIAEENGFITTLGTWVLDTAFKFQKKWQENFGYKGIMSVNISPIQLRENNFIDTLLDITKKHDVKPETIELEITESVFINEIEKTAEKLRAIKEMGFGISLDDFGTGYSSLRYLQTLPFTALKIDKSFVQSITEDDNFSAEITNAIISMVTKMGLDTIAEGVEKVDQLKILRTLNCKNAQGFLNGKPMDASHIELYLSGDESALDKI
ncbi:MAG: bifunctional diguanylate cyclase/phosphodiesterase [Treponema sp.]|nr:bifunctional diguanylate cyclase/phosphodiesterase [Treponema sp.]MBD5434733.1 bifunctional diguanylate cyclase/phosphodiesterase [Treponema sp.]